MGLKRHTYINVFYKNGALQAPLLNANLWVNQDNISSLPGIFSSTEISPTALHSTTYAWSFMIQSYLKVIEVFAYYENAKIIVRLGNAREQKPLCQD